LEIPGLRIQTWGTRCCGSFDAGAGVVSHPFAKGAKGWGTRRQVAHGLAGAAQYEVERLYGHLPESRDKEFLRALPVWVIERN
jgi:hypothetical protein